MLRIPFTGVSQPLSLFSRCGMPSSFAFPLSHSPQISLRGRHNPFALKSFSTKPWSARAARLPWRGNSGKGNGGKGKGSWFVPGTGLLMASTAIMLGPGSHEEDDDTLFYPSSVTSPYEEVRKKRDVLEALSDEALSSGQHLREQPFGTLLRSYFVYAISASPFLVANGENVFASLSWMRDHIPILGPLAWNGTLQILEATFFHHFLAGTSPESCYPFMSAWKSKDVGILLNLTCELPPNTDWTRMSRDGVIPSHVDSAVKAILAAARFEDIEPSETASDEEGMNMLKHAHIPRTDSKLKSTMLSFKLTTFLANPQVLERASNSLKESTSYLRGDIIPASPLFPVSIHLEDSDLATLHSLHEEMKKVLQVAKSKGVRVLLDAEQSYYQPAIDRFFDVLAEEFNSASPSTLPGPTLFNTLQCYLRKSPEWLESALRRAEDLNYSYGVKLVRGAYKEHEMDLWERSGRVGEAPIWGSKPETDSCWNETASRLIERVNNEMKSDGNVQTAAFLATHNAESVRKVIQALRERGLAMETDEKLEVKDDVRSRVYLAQLTGMSDSLTQALSTTLVPKSDGIPIGYKSAPYASVEASVPYLLRRANENKSILEGDGSGRGGARGERMAVGREIRRRFGFAW